MSAHAVVREQVILGESGPLMQVLVYRAIERKGAATDMEGVLVREGWTQRETHARA